MRDHASSALNGHNNMRHTRRYTADPVEQLLSGSRHEVVVSHGRSQYSTSGGASSCGLAALNCARVVLSKETGGPKVESLLRSILLPDTFEEILGPCASWSNSTHLDVEDIYDTPVFRRSLDMVTSEYGITGLPHFRKLLRTLQETTEKHGCSCCAVITRPPEIISCFCIAGPTKTMFLIFDSHPRPDLHPEGAAFVCYASADAAANYLARLLQYDPSLFADGDVQWEAQLLDNFSGHVFVSKQPSPSADDWAAATLEASLQILHVRAECADLKSRNAVLDGEIAELRREVARYKAARSAEPTSSRTSWLASWTGFGSSTEQTVKNPSRGTTPTQSWYSASGSKPTYGLGYPSIPVAEDARKRITPQQQQSSNHATSTRSAYGQTLNTPPPNLSSSARAREKARAPSESPNSISPAPSSYARSSTTAKPSSSKGKARLESPTPAGSDVVSSDWEFALRQQLLFSEEDTSLFEERAKLLGAEKAYSPRAGPSSSVAPAPSIYGRLGAAVGKSSAIGRSARLESSKVPPPVIAIKKDITVLTDLEFALQQQLLYNEEDANLSEERAKLLSLAPRTFACGVCFEKIPEDFVAELTECGHKYCRDCIRQYVSSELNVPRFPIVCPLCKADETRREPAVVDHAFIRQIGVSEEQYTWFVQMELSAFAVTISCRSCNNSFMLDRGEYEESKIIACPLPQCESSWCKQCSQIIEPGGPEHSCDGSNELHDLMGKRGWKHCPGCQTPSEKIDGCNHMTCTAPGCNMHFCYSCGKTIVRSVAREQINEAIGEHYRTCNIFDEIPDEPVPP